MATYYVSPSGSDSNNGLGPDASAASNKPWLTIGKALGAAGISSSDTVYIAPGTYREVVTVAMTSATVETFVLGDPSNSRGFRNGSGVWLDPGEVIWTAYTTNDTTAPSVSSTLDLAGRDFLTFRFITFIGGQATTILMNTKTSTNITFQQCAIFHSEQTTGFSIDCDFNTPNVLLIDKCFIYSVSASGFFLHGADTGASGSDYDVGCTISNCFIASPSAGLMSFSPSGGLTFKAGGLILKNNTLLASYGGSCVTTGAGCSTSIPIIAMNNYVVGGLNANTLGQISENYNYITANITHTNVTQGANTATKLNRAPTFTMTEGLLYGLSSRPFMEPKIGSWMLGFGNDATYTTSEDFRGTIRPAGGQTATKGIGYLERGNTFARETSTVRTGANAASITGPGWHEFMLPVDANPTTVSVYVQWDATYAGTKPQMVVVNGDEIGVSSTTVTATGASGQWEQLSTAFTASRAGVVTIRMVSNDTNGAGKMFIDDFTAN